MFLDILTDVPRSCLMPIGGGDSREISVKQDIYALHDLDQTISSIRLAPSTRSVIDGATLQNGRMP